MPEDSARKTYLGDGVYAEFDGFQVWIWTSDGLRESPRIALDPDVIEALGKFCLRCADLADPKEVN